ncbi:Glycosylphosphatidylinositol specific phospholipase D1 [Lunasporangiospora selenospora]|uniref:Phosphatidylinositol-glycan-specific phospholipase D n=1 Tax=Lunasporangiospora selenospora TaxID=979761 RepID=A0A9P6FZK7_9FUNG|nr:Glycosylphosphatidylinositol specific phospholipase D1 [Lunasporangiospora selenospora]
MPTIQRTMRPLVAFVALSVLVTLDLRSSSLSARFLVSGCGVTIHNEVAFRASQLLLSSAPDPFLSSPHSQVSSHSKARSTNAEPGLTKESSNALLRDYAPLLEMKELLFAGSFFPDWGYNCIGKLWNDAAEEAHWPPFTKAAVQYILEVYPKPWSDHAKELIAFLFGAVSHQLGDMSWHALRGLDAGFIGALSKTSFDGDYGKGHTLADIGAEFVLSHMSRMNHLLTSWKVPIKDISEIYRRMGFKVPGMVLTHCMKNGFAGAQANARLGSQLFPVYASKRMRKHTGNSTEILTESQVAHQHGEFSIGSLGGDSATLKLNNAGMEIRTSETGMVSYHIEGANESKFDPVDLHDATHPPQEQAKNPYGDQTVSNSQHQQQHTFSRNRHSSQGGIRYKATKSSESSNPCVTFSDETGLQLRTLYLPIPYSSFGRAAVTGDFDDDGIVDLAIGAPHMATNPLIPSQGSVFVVSSNSVFESDEVRRRGGTEDPGIDVRTVASRMLQGDPAEPQSRFGWSLAVVDMNQDGIDDLAIGAPGRGAKDLRYDGTVFVYFGHAKTGLSLEPDLIISHDRELDDNEWLIPQSASTLAGLGYLVRGIDLTGSGFKDLVLAMPMTTIPLKRPRRGGPKSEEKKTGDGDNGDNDDDDDEDKKKSYFKQQAGKVSVFLSKKKHVGPKLDSHADWELHGNDSFGWFGSSLAVVSQDSSQGTQITTMSKVSRWIQRALSWLHSINVIDRKASRVTSTRRILVVSSPTFGVGEKDAMRGKIQGFVVPEFKDIIEAPSFDPKQLPVFTIHGDTKFQQLGSQLVTTTRPVDLDANSGRFYDALRSEPKTEDLLIIGSQSEDVPHRLPKIGWQWQAGKVRILDLARIPDGTDVFISTLDRHPDRIVRDSLQGSQSMAHLSAAMQVSMDGKSVWLAEPYAKSEVGRILEWEPDYRAKGSKDDDGTLRSRWPQWPRWPGRGGRGKGPQEGDGDGDDDDDNGGVKQCFIGSDYRGRFGSQILIADLDQSGLDAVVVTSSHASQYAVMAGTVTIKRLFQS